MKSILDTTTTALEWKEPIAGDLHFELWADGDLLATMVFATPSLDGATVRTTEGDWTLRRSGFLKHAILLREEGSDVDLALFHRGLLGGGHLRFTNDVTFHWRHEGLASAVWSFVSDGGEVLVSLKLEPREELGPGSRKVQAEVQVTPEGHFLPRLPLLAAMGWYLMLLHRQEVVAEAEVLGNI